MTASGSTDVHAWMQPTRMSNLPVITIIHHALANRPASGVTRLVSG